MKGGYVYTIVFILIASVVFTLLLAGTNAFYAPKIKANELLDERTALLYVFNLDNSGNADEITERFNRYIIKETISELELYRYDDEQGHTLAYAVPFTGPGLWGSISGYLAVTPELDQITGLVFTKHSETPGLGGRIDELAFKEQFRNLSFDKSSQLIYGADVSGGQIDAITGATSTSNAVLAIVNNLIAETIDNLEVASNG